MNFMKKLAKMMVLCTCILLVALLFAACGTTTQQPTQGANQTASSEPTAAPTDKPTLEKSYMKAGDTYRILVWNTRVEDEPFTQEGIRGQILNERADELKDLYDVTATYIVAPGNWLFDAIETSAAGTPICDILHAGGSFAMLQLFGSGSYPGEVLVPLSQYKEVAAFDDARYWDVSAQEAGTFNGNQYFIVPQDVGFEAVALNMATMFNKDLIKKGGYTEEQLYDWSDNGEWTFDKMREVAINCTDLDQDTYGLNVGQNACTLLTMVTANGGDFIRKEEVDGVMVDRFVGNSAKTIEAIQYFVSMARDDKCVYLGGSPLQDEENVNFVANKYALMVTYINRVPKIYKSMESDYGMLMPPKGPSADRYISDKNWFSPYCVMSNIPNVEGTIQAASIFLKAYMASDDPDNMALLEAEAQAYRLDTRSINTLKKIPEASYATSYMVFNVLGISGDSDFIGGVCYGHTLEFIDGTLSPQAYYESVVSAVNIAIDTALALK